MKIGQELTELTSKIEVEDAIYSKNKRKFSQTNSTPAIMESLVSKLGFLGNTKYCEEIL